jgi:transcriptional regulator with XRE-family HTH domain
VAQSSPTVRQRELGIRLRELRHSCGLTVEEVADKLLCSAPKISRAETGARRPTLRDVRDLCSIYGADSATLSELMSLAHEAHRLGWWTQFDGLEDTSLIGLEQEATCIRCFGMYSLPTLLQTKEYARAVIKGITPRIDLYTLDLRVEVRLLRQRRLSFDQDLRYEAILDEAVLYRRVGGAAVMAAQLDKILKLILEARVTVQVIPLGVGAYPAIDSNFYYLEFGDSYLCALIFVEGLVRHLCLERSAEVERYRETLDNLRDVALSPGESARKVREVRDGFALADL